MTNISKSEKSAYFRHVFANNFFWVHFFKTFSTDSKSAWNSAFFDTHFELKKKKKIFALISTFCTLWLHMRRKRLKKTENLFLWMCLRILLGSHQRVCINKLLKSLYPNAHTNYSGWGNDGGYIRPQNYHYMARFVCQLMEAEGGGGGGKQLCICDYTVTATPWKWEAINTYSVPLTDPLFAYTLHEERGNHCLCM